MPRLRSLLSMIAATVAGCVLIFVLVEGLSSTVLLAWDSSTKLGGQLGSSRHVRFDPELGWTNKENTSLVDRYGAGQDIFINEQGLRAKQTFERASPEGRRRILCSGDSFTFGKGVGNEATWCARLGADRPDLQTINAGEEAYGLGQAYLKTKALAEELDWDVNLFAFIADDIRRMATSDFVGRGKPQLFLRDGELVVGNVPVPEASQFSLWVRANRRVFQGLRFLELAGRVGRKFSSGPTPTNGPTTDAEKAALAGAILKAAQKLSEAKGARFVAVFLPAGRDRAAAEAIWEPLIAEQCAKLGIPFFNAVAPTFERFDDAERTAMYDPVHRHYSVQGNQRIAELVAEYLAREVSPVEAGDAEPSDGEPGEAGPEDPAPAAP